MKILISYFSILLLFLTAQALNGQTCNGYIYLNSQAEVDSFPINYGCNIISGDLTISNVSNIDSLYQVQKIYGGLNISNSTLDNLGGFNNLDSVNYDINLNLNGVQHLTAELPKLKFCAYIAINGVDTLSGFNSIVTLQDLNAYCAYNNSFNNLLSMNYLDIYNNSSITNSFNMLDAFINLDIAATIIDNSFNKINNINNLDISAQIVKNSFNNLVSCNDLRLESFNSTQTSFIILTTIIDRLEIWNTTLENLNFLQNLESVSEVIIFDNNNLNSISALSGLNPSNLSKIDININNSLSYCHISPFCTFLSNQNSNNYIDSNNCGCNNKAEILQNCNSTVTSNNDCNLSIPISIDTICMNNTVLNNSNFSPPTGPLPSCGNYAGSDFWYRFKTPQSGNIKIDYTLSCVDYHVALYNGSCGGLSEVACEVVTPIKEYFGLTPNTTYYLRYWDANNDDIGPLAFCITALHVAPPNDDCFNAIDLLFSDTLCNNIINGTTKGATPDESGSCTIVNPKKVYYKLTAPASANYMLNLSNNNQPMTIEIYEGDCTNNSHLYCTAGDVVLLNENVDYILALYTNDIYSYSPFTLCIEYYEFLGNPGALGINIINPIQTLQVNGGIAIANTNVNVPGSIRFNGSNFQGYTSSGWKTFVSYTPLQDPNKPSEKSFSETASQNDKIQNYEYEEEMKPLQGNERETREINGAKEVIIGDGIILPTQDIKIKNRVYIVEIDDQQFYNICSSYPLSEISLSNGHHKGQLIYLTCQENTIIIKDKPNSNLNLKTDRKIERDDVLTLIWTGEKWLEVQFSDN